MIDKLKINWLEHILIDRLIKLILCYVLCDSTAETSSYEHIGISHLTLIFFDHWCGSFSIFLFFQLVTRPHTVADGLKGTLHLSTTRSLALSMPWRVIMGASDTCHKCPILCFSMEQQNVLKLYFRYGNCLHSNIGPTWTNVSIHVPYLWDPVEVGNHCKSLL